MVALARFLGLGLHFDIVRGGLEGVIVGLEHRRSGAAHVHHLLAGVDEVRNLLLAHRFLRLDDAGKVALARLLGLGHGDELCDTELLGLAVGLAAQFLERGPLQGLHGTDELLRVGLLGEAVDHDATEVVDLGYRLGVLLVLGLVGLEEVFPELVHADFARVEVDLGLDHAGLVAQLDGRLRSLG